MAEKNRNGGIVIKINQIYHGDCLVVMPKIPTGSIDMIMADIPYGMTSCSWDSIVPLELLWAEYKRIIKPNGAICLTAMQPFTSILVMSNLKWYKCEWIWEKGYGAGFLNAKKQPLRCHESVLIFYRKQPVYNIEVGERKRKGNSQAFRSIAGGECYRGMSVTHMYEPMGFPRTVFYLPHDPERSDSTRFKDRHPTQKPVALYEKFIKHYSSPGDTVLDNCSGSGTAAIACISTGRNYICIEKEEKYYRQSVIRIQDFSRPAIEKEKERIASKAITINGPLFKEKND